MVAAVPQLGTTSPEELHRDIADQVETQARDLEFAMGLAMDIPSVNRRKLAIVGYSFGGSVAIQIASRNPNVDAVVGLDASFVSGGGASLDIKKLRMPLLSGGSLSSSAGPSIEFRLSNGSSLLDSVYFSTGSGSRP